MPRVAVVTDSTAMVPDDLVAEHGIVVVPLQVIIGEECYEEGLPESAPAAVVAALADKKPVSTSRPAPEKLRGVYARLAEQGYDEVVSVHVSGEMSGTVESARIAARDAPIPVVALDTRAVGPCVGFAVLAAVRAVADGASAQDAAAAALARSSATRSLFYVDTLEYLRRGGRIGAAPALLGSALAVKPLLTIGEGRVVPLERVRTAARALLRLEELAVEAAGERQVEVAVAHMAAPERAKALVGALTGRLAEQLATPVRCGEIGAALTAHVGPGVLAVVVAPAL
jgi:DegV family protein with EDD domain